MVASASSWLKGIAALRQQLKAKTGLNGLSISLCRQDAGATKRVRHFRRLTLFHPVADSPHAESLRRCSSRVYQLL